VEEVKLGEQTAGENIRACQFLLINLSEYHKLDEF